MTESVSTGCDVLDGPLDGGFERGTVTQVYGPSAAGRTDVALSAAVRVAVAGDTVVYIDTEGLSVDRFQQLAEAAAPEDVESVTSRLMISEAYDFEDQEQAVHDAEEFAASADLIVPDSATGLYRLEWTAEDDGGEALRRVARQVTHPLSLARKHDLVVILTNQVYADPDPDRTCVLGGHTLEHWAGTVVRLDRFRGGNRRVALEKHRAKPAGETATFKITNRGLSATDM